MKLTASVLLFAHSALAFFLRGPVLESALAPSLGGKYVHRRQSQTPIVGNLTLAQTEAGYAAMCSAANSNTGSSAVLADINNVTVNALAIQAEFRNVAAQLSVIDSENLDTQKFSANWTALTQQWTNILWASRDTASDTVVYCQEFIDTIMPFVVNATGTKVPPALGVEVLQEYITQAKTLQTNDKITANAFASLQTDLTIFAASFGTFAEKLKAMDDAKISTLTAEIDALNKQISKLDQEINAIAAAMAVTIFVDISALALFPEFAPFIIGAGVLAVAGEATAWGILATERSAAANQLAQDSVTIRQLQQEEETIAQANSTLHSISGVTIPAMVGQLQAFNSIWNAVVSDCEQGIAFLNSANNLRVFPQIFWSTVEHVPCLYEQMITALDMYASGITSSSIPPPTKSNLAVKKALTTGQFHATVQSIIAKANVKAAASSGGKAV